MPSDDVVSLDLRVDLSSYADEVYDVHETIVVRPEAAGEAITLFGTSFQLGRASHGYAYDGQRATFCVEPYEAGDEVTLEIAYRISIAEQNLGAGNIFGIQLWGDVDGEHVVGAYSAPFFSSLWLLSPQTAPWIDAQHAGNATVDAVNLTVTVPEEPWTVVGPGAPSVEGRDWRFAIDGRMPLSTLSFAASRGYVEVEPLEASGGVEVSGRVFPSSVESATDRAIAARDGVNWMASNIAPYGWPTDLTFAEIPGYPGGFEHTSAVWLGSGVFDAPSANDYVAIHEAVHHWWGNAVHIADWPHFWMSEGFTDWTTVFAIEESLDPGAAANRQGSFRDDAAELSYPASGPLRLPDDANFAQHLNDHGLFFYRYGAAFLEMVDQRLRRDHGTDLVAVMSSWYADRKGQPVTTEGFRDYLIAETGEGPTWTALFDQWVYQTPCPTLELSGYTFDGNQASFTVSRVDGAGQSLDTLELTSTDAPSVETTVSLPTGTDQTTVTLPASSEPQELVADPDGLYILRLTTASGWAGPPVTHVVP